MSDPLLADHDPLIGEDHRKALGTADFQCPACADHLRRCAALLEERDDAEREIRRLRKRVKALEDDKPSRSRPKKKDDETLRAHAMFGEAQEVWAFWRQHCHPKAREFSGKRLRAVIDRLEGGYTTRELKLAVYGAARHPNVMDDVVYNELELICRDPSKTDNFMGRGRLALAQDRERGLGPAEGPADHAQRREQG